MKEEIVSDEIEAVIDPGLNNPYVKAVLILNKAFDYFNDLYCEGTLRRPLITILSRGRKPCYGWHWKDKWTYGNSLHTEIMIAAETLRRSIFDVLETLLHEMVHLYNSQQDVKDCNEAQYHNKHFKKCAESVFFLEVDKMPQRGYALTKLSVKSRDDVQNFISSEDIKDFYLVRNPAQGGGKPVKKQYTLNVSEDDYFWFKQIREETGSSSKQMFSLIRDSYEQITLENQKVS